MGPNRLARLLVMVLALVMLAGAVPVQAEAPRAEQDEVGLRIAIDAMRQLATDSRRPATQKKTTRPKKGLPLKLGKDGRLTVLLMGSDWRPNDGGERLDVIMVATIDPVTGKAAVVSIPRDMAGIPLAGGGNSGGMRVNSIYYIRYRNPSLRHEAYDRKGLNRFTRDIATFLGTEIDYWAVTRFGGFARIVDKLGGVRLDIKEEVDDPSYHRRNWRGVYFPVADDFRLKGDPDCKPKPRKCRSALAYVRSRKGTMGGTFNSDWARAERQQQLVRAAVRQVLDEDGPGLRLLARLLLVRDQVETNIPTTAEAAAQLYFLLRRMKLPDSNMVVLAPATWSGAAGDGTHRPNLTNIRRWVDKHFYKVKKRR